MKNVLLIGSELGKGGAERSISLLSYYLERHYNVTLCILSGTDRQRYYKTCGKVIFVDPPAVSNIFDKIKWWRYRIKRVREIKRENNVDISISFLEGPDYVNVLTKGKEKVVLSIRGSKMHDKIIAGIMGVIRKKVFIPQLYKRADEIVCVTDALSEELKEHFDIPEKVLRTIYNFYETDNIVSLSHEPLSNDEQRIFSKPVIINSGRLHVAKEQDKLIRLLAKIKVHREVRLMILGDGSRKPELMELCASLGLRACDWQLSNAYDDADVYFMGFQKNAFKFYKQSRIFALSSSWEGFPNVLAEALICNIPVVSTDCYTGPREILNIKGLANAPVVKPNRTPVGSLLPMLQQPSETVMDIWIDEILYWLDAPLPSVHEFTKLTARFTMDAMLTLWRDVIEN